MTMTTRLVRALAAGLLATPVVLTTSMVEARPPAPAVLCAAAIEECEGPLTVAVNAPVGTDFSIPWYLNTLSSGLEQGTLTDETPSTTATTPLVDGTTYMVDFGVPVHLHIDSFECAGGTAASSSAPNSRTFTFDGGVAQGVDCVLTVSPMAELVITKTSNGGTGEFPFILGEVGEESDTVTVETFPGPNGVDGIGVRTLYLDAGTYSLEENANDLWFEDSLICTGPGGDIDPSSFEVELGERYECEAVNTLGVYFDITKSWSMPEEEQPEFATFYWDGESEATFDVPTGETYSGTLVPGEHQLTELVEGYDVELVCDKFTIDGEYIVTYYGDGNSVDVAAKAGDRLFCRASNEPLVQVNIFKQVNLDVEPAPIFEFTSGTQSMQVVASRPGDMAAVVGTLWVSAGQVVIEEDGPAGWVLDDVNCAATDGDLFVYVVDSDSFTFETEPGMEVDCTVYNVRGVSVSKTVAEFAATDTPGEYAVVWEISAYNPLGGSLGSLTLTDVVSLPLGVSLSDIVVSGSDLVDGWDGQAETDLADGFGLDSGETKTWTISAVVTMEPNLPLDDLECMILSDGATGLGNTAMVRYGDNIYASDYVCTDLPAADLEVEKEPFGGPTDNGDGTWTQVYGITVHNDGDGYATYDLVDEPNFAPIFEIVSVSYSQGDDLPAVVDPWTGMVELALDEAIGAGQTHSYTVSINFTLPDLEELEDSPTDVGWYCEFDGGPLNEHGLLNYVYLTVGGQQWLTDLGPKRPLEMSSACVDGPNPNILVDKEVVGYTYVGTDGIVVDFDITVSNLSNPDGSDVLAGPYVLVDPLFPLTIGVDATAIELLSVEGGVENVDYEVDLDTESGFGATGVLSPDDTHVFHVRVTYLADVEEGFFGTCPDLTVVPDIESSDGVPGGAFNVVIWADIFASDGSFPIFFFPGEPTSVESRQRLQKVVEIPEGFPIPRGVGMSYDCLDLGAVYVDKGVIDDDGGNAEPDDFTFSLLQPGGEVERTVTNDTPTLVVAGEYTLVEDANDNYTPGDFQCEGFDFLDDFLNPESVEPFGDRPQRTQRPASTPGEVDLTIDPSWGWSCSIMNDDKPADLSIDKSDGGAVAVAGGAPITYTFEVTNEVGFLTGDVMLRDELPEGWSWVEGSVTGPCASVSASGADLQCVIAEADLANPGDSVTVTAQARVAADAESGDYLNAASIDSDSDPLTDEDGCVGVADTESETVAYSNVDCEITPVVREASMSATKTSNAVGPVAIGGSVVFTLTVTNEGPSTVLAGTTLVDDLPAGLNLISINAPGWTCNAVDPVVCEYGSVLAVGETAPPIQITTTVATGASGTITNTGVFTGIVDVEELDPAELARVEQVPVVVTATAVASAVAVIQVRSGGTIPETGADSLGWLPVASLLVGVGLFGLLIARRRRPAALR
ncbi:MAG TPA: hypothetical protein DCR14_00805 [Acidimicrobiaceae bacterium]|nr:hypothetical protein [Acidimicrobiaceae bacterium]